jgi:hypothetical protein
MGQRFEERTKRFLNAKERTIGIDKHFLDNQVAEKKVLNDEDIASTMAEGMSKSNSFLVR